MPKIGDLELWWIPQVPMKSFKVRVNSLKEAILIYNTLAKYDLFQFNNNIKPDYSNAGGLCEWDGDEWISYYNEKDDKEFEEYL